MDASEWWERPRAEVVDQRPGDGCDGDGVAAKYGEAFSFGSSAAREDGDCIDRGESTGDGSSSRIDTRDGDIGESDPAMTKVRVLGWFAWRLYADISALPGRLSCEGNL